MNYQQQLENSVVAACTTTGSVFERLYAHMNKVELETLATSLPLNLVSDYLSGEDLITLPAKVKTMEENNQKTNELNYERLATAAVEFIKGLNKSERAEILPTIQLAKRLTKGFKYCFVGETLEPTGNFTAASLRKSYNSCATAKKMYQAHLREERKNKAFEFLSSKGMNKDTISKMPLSSLVTMCAAFGHII